MLLMLSAPRLARAENVAETSGCVLPVVDELGQGDPEIDRALRAAAPLVLTSSRNWQFANAAAECGSPTRVRFRGHRSPQVHYAVEVELPGQPTASLSVDSQAAMGTFAIAEALCVNALLLLGQPIRPPAPVPDRTLRLWLAPTSTAGVDVAVFGSEVGVQWSFSEHLWLAGSVGFEAFGHGANAAGKYQYSVVQGAILGGWQWQPAPTVGLAVGVGLLERTWLSHLQTTALHEDYDFDIAVESEMRVSFRLTRTVRLDLAARPSLGLEDIVVAAPGESELFRVPHFLMQFAAQIGIDL